MTTKKKAKQVKAKAKEVENKKNAKSASKSVPKSAPKSVAKSVPKKAASSTAKSVPKKVIPSTAKPKTGPKTPAPPAAKGKRNAPSPDKAEPVDKKVKKTKSQEQIVKVVTKGGAAVDMFVPGKDSFRVFSDSGKIYSATLNQSNLDHNNNKFYIIQILVKQSTGAIMVWNRWGRVGVPGQNALKGPFSKDQAIMDYNKKFREKTSGGNYREIEIKYDDEKVEEPKKEEKKGGKPKKQAESAMDARIQKLIRLIFDVTVMNNTMKEIGYDAKRMPLGKLGDSTIKEAYSILNKLIEAIKKKETSKYKQLSSQFYTLIPHDFGFKPMINFILDTDDKVKAKLKMLETISDMKITTKLLDQKTDDEKSVLDQNYSKLGCDVKSLDPSSADFKLLDEYFHNTKGNSYSRVKINTIYQVKRDSEFKNFNQKLGNNMLLWHGSRVSNFVGILSQGLRIAPPEAPASGYLFGKGIYLADMAEKSINYCRTGGSDTALILLIEGALGKPNVLLQSNCQAKQAMERAKKDSTKCHGSKAPPEESYVKLKSMTVPKGQAKPTSSGSYMGHNEFIVYNKDQARIRYILEMDMKGS